MSDHISKILTYSYIVAISQEYLSDYVTYSGNSETNYVTIAYLSESNT